MVASRHSAGTSASRQQETIQPPQQLPHSTTQHQCPPRTDADAHDATPEGAPETASADAMHDQLVDSSSYPSQLLTLEVLRRPVESAQYTSVHFGESLFLAGMIPSIGS